MCICMKVCVHEWTYPGTYICMKVLVLCASTFLCMNILVHWGICAWTYMSMNKPEHERTCTWTYMSMNGHVHELTCAWMYLSMNIILNNMGLTHHRGAAEVCCRSHSSYADSEPALSLQGWMEHLEHSESSFKIGFGSILISIWIRVCRFMSIQIRNRILVFSWQKRKKTFIWKKNTLNS